MKNNRFGRLFYYFNYEYLIFILVKQVLNIPVCSMQISVEEFIAKSKELAELYLDKVKHSNRGAVVIDYADINDAGLKLYPEFPATVNMFKIIYLFSASHIKTANIAIIDIISVNIIKPVNFPKSHIIYSLVYHIYQ